MAHLQKYTKTQLGITAHYDRSRQSKRENIDRAKTCENYNLAPCRDCSQGEYIAERLKNVKIQNRSDVNYICDWIVTMPKDLDTARQAEFFRTVYEYCNNKYGGENGKNVVSAYVHLDEATPHMHFCFLPVVADKRRGGEKLSSKIAVGGPKDLQNFHINLQKFCTERLKTQVNILNDATREGNKSINDLKRGTATAKIKTYNDLMTAARAALDEAKELLAAANERRQVIKFDAPHASPRRRWFGLVTDSNQFVISKTDLDRLCRTAKTASDESGKYKKLLDDSAKFNTALAAFRAPADELAAARAELASTKKQLAELSQLADGATVADLRGKVEVLNAENNLYKQKLKDTQEAAAIVHKINAVDANIIPQTLKMWEIQENQRRAAEKAKKEQKAREIAKKQQKKQQQQQQPKKKTKSNDFSL